MKNRLRELRELGGLTQPELAKMVGTTFQTIYKLENGHRKLSPIWIYKLCKALNCRPHQLLPSFIALYTPRQIELLEKLEKLDMEERRVTKLIEDL